MAAGSVWTARVTDKTFVVFVFQMTDDAEPFRTIKTAGRGRRQIALATDQQVAGGRVAAALCTGAWRSSMPRSLTDDFC